MLGAELVGDTEEPASEAAVVAQGRQVLHGAHEGGLYEVEAGGLVTHELLDEGEEGQLIAGEESFPGALIAPTRGEDSAEKVGRVIRRGGGGQYGRVKQSPQ